MTNWSLAIRMSLGIVGVTVLLVMLSQYFGLLPTAHEPDRARRQAVCESLAVHASLAMQRGDRAGLDEIARVVAERNPEIAYLAVLPQHDDRVLEFGRQELRDAPEPGMMMADVPVFAGGEPWGTVRVVFDAPAETSLADLWKDPAIRLATFLSSAGLIIYFLYSLFLARMLQPPTSPALPERVRETLDTFSEGILVLDREHRVAFANAAFKTSRGQRGEEDEIDEIEGSPAAELGWLDDGESDELPWEKAHLGGRYRAALRLIDANDQPHPMSVRAIPINDDDGAFLGSLATFDDLTTVEQKNARMHRLLALLRESRNHIKEQNRELQRLATEDPLTKCLNRRAFYERLQMFFSAAKRYRQPLSCIVCDIDRFKSINDTYGHAMGDEVLKLVSGTLREALRETDLLCRLGGEEFCIVLPHTDLAGARDAAERIRKLVAAADCRGLSATISLGISDLSFDAPTEEQLVDQADQALYIAKRTGRNRSITFDAVGQTEIPTEA